MMDFIIEYEAYLWWIFAIPGGYLVGKILEKTLFKYLHRFARKTENQFDDKVIDAFSRVAVPLSCVVGIWLAYHHSDLFNNYREQIKKGSYVFTIIMLSWSASTMVVSLTRIQMESIGRDIPRTSIFTNILRVLVYIIGGMFILDVLEISIAPALTALGVGGLAVALALQDTLGNLFAGLQMIAAKKLKPGDYISLEGNHLIILPNATVANGIVKNFILPDSQNSVLVGVGVAYDSDLKFVEKVTIEVATEIQKTIPGAVPDHEPFVRYNEFGDSSINFNVILRSGDFTSQYIMKHEFVKALHERFNKEGIEIPFPIRTVYLKKDKGEE
jgi:small-conductance mechanosensitive channel